MGGRIPQHNTREKIRLQLKKAVDRCDFIVANLQRVDELAADRSTQVTVTLPQIVAFTEVLKNTLIVFREGF